MRANRLLSPLILVASLVACAHGVPGTAAVRGQAPRVVVELVKLGASQEQACERIAHREVKDRTGTALAAGMLAGDYEALAQVAQEQHVTVTFRSGNPACLPHLFAGVQSKPHEILQKTWDAVNLRPQDQHLAGLVSDQLKKPPQDVVIDTPQLTLKDGEPVTCDYDLMDLIEDDGGRVPGEGSRDLRVRAALNARLPPTPRGHRDRVMHGAQTAYRDYLAQHAGERELFSLYKPEAPLTAMGSEGRGWRLETVEDVLNFYRCRGVGLPAEWDVVGLAQDGSLAPL
ncbi:MAG: hypothetical protein HY901_33990 [Deltaproteobacteria bacterium]|nr:hypothetical protein [Deltaproteobacteria bacterium]